MISGEVGSWVRKHTGSADTETKAIIDEYVTNAHMYYTQLCSDKAAMETITLTRRKQSQLLGVLFAEYEILTTEQVSSVRDQMKKPYHVFASTDSLWAFYNYVTVALQSSHPKTWMEDQRILHYFISTIGNFQQCSTPAQVVEPINNVSTPVEDPLTSNYGQPENQTNLLVQIAEVTGDDSMLQAQYPVTPEGAFTNTAEVMEQAMKDELVFGVSGVAVSADGLRNVPIEEVLAVMKAEDSIPESIENKTVAIDIPEGTEIVEKEVLMSAEVVVMDLGDPESTPEPLQDYIERTAVEEVDHVVVENEEVLHQSEEVVIHIETDQEYLERVAEIEGEPEIEVVEATENTFEYEVETIHYTDPAGNTFEAPVVVDIIDLNETTKQAVVVQETFEDNDEEIFAEEDNFDLDFNDDTNEDPDSIPDFF
jgi:hypothetical protein